MIWKLIAEAHAPITGWCSWEKAQTLCSIIFATRPQITIEIGIWAGKSFVPMAMAHKELGVGMAFAIDPWQQSISIAGQTNPADTEWWSHQDRHDYAFKQFEETIYALGLQNVTKIHRVKSDDFDPPENIGLLHIDGNHGEQSIRDVRRFCPKVISGGFLVLDDLQWSGGSVMQSLELAKSMKFKEIYRVKDSTNQNYWAVFVRL